MAETTIQPTPCVWMGDNPEWEDRWTIGAVYRLDGWIGVSSFWGDVRPIIVMCPSLLHWEDGRYSDRLSSTPFCIHSYPTPNDEVPNQAAHWEVTVDESSLVLGQKPLITVSPSIHLVGIWHGWLEQGVLHN